MEHQSQEQQQQQQTAIQNDTTGKRCPNCGAILSDDDLFCPECGTKCSGELHTCPVCGTQTAEEKCPKCGNRVVPVHCPNCGTESFFDFCENCGTALTTQAQTQAQLMAEAAQTVQETDTQVEQLTEEEALEIQQEFAHTESDELKAFIRKVQEHKILKEEKDYFEKREKRIKKVFGANPYEVEIPDPDEEKFLQKAYENLRKTVEKREEQKKAQKLDQWKTQQDKKDARKLAEETARLQAELTERLNQKAGTITEEEKKLLQEETQRQQKAIEEKIKEQRLIKEQDAIREIEQKSLENSHLGRYVAVNSNWYNEIILKEDGTYYDVTKTTGGAGAGSYGTFVGVYTIKDGDLQLKVTKTLSEKIIGFKFYCKKFTGYLAYDHMSFKGFWIGNGTNCTYFKE